MKILSNILLTISIAIITSFSINAYSQENNVLLQKIIKNGSQASIKRPEKLFTGNVRIDPLFPSASPARTSGAYVTFEPGARSA